MQCILRRLQLKISGKISNKYFIRQHEDHEEYIWRNVQLKFIVFGDPLLELEETRARAIQITQDKSDRPQNWVDHATYMIELDFRKIKRISYQFNETSSDNLTILLEMRTPASCRKRHNNNLAYVRSPFNMHEQSQFLNYWNINQSFYLKGRSDRAKLDKILKTVQKENPSIKIFDSLKAQYFSKPEIVMVCKSLMSRQNKFSLLIEELRLPLRYAILSLLSCGKISIFD